MGSDIIKRSHWTGNELDERPIIDIYRKVEESRYMEIDICFPLKTKQS